METDTETDSDKETVIRDKLSQAHGNKAKLHRCRPSEYATS